MATLKMSCKECGKMSRCFNMDRDNLEQMAQALKLLQGGLEYFHSSPNVHEFQASIEWVKEESNG